MTEKLSKHILVTIIFLGLAGELAWSVENQFFNLFIYNEIAPVPFYVSLMVAASAITATVTAITMGALSDKIGRRKIFFLVGFPLWALTTAMFPLAGFLSPILLAVSVAIAFDCVMTFFGAMASDAVLSAYMTDVTTLQNRGTVNSIREIGLLIAIFMTYGLSGFIIEVFGYYIFFYLVGAVVGVLGTIGAILAPEPVLSKKEQPYWELIGSTFRIDDLEKNKDCFLVLLSAMFWGIGFNVMFPFLLIYVEHHLGYALTEASIIIAIALFFALIATIPVGLITDKIGRKKLAIIAIVIEAISLFCFALVQDFIVLVVVAIGLLFAMMLFDVSARTWTKDLFPEDKRGQFSGYFILFTVLGGMVIGPLIGGYFAETFGTPIVIDNIPGFVPTPIIFIIAGLMILLAIIPLIKAKDLLVES
ncbi:MAG: MFS transporter [Candidatus Hermodarchaeota archaeon]